MVKGKRIFQIAKEFNISHETIINFLNKKGYEIKSHMTLVTDDMYDAIMHHFKKEKESVEKHQKKIETLKKPKISETSSVIENKISKPKTESKLPGKKKTTAVTEEKKPVEESPLPQTTEIDTEVEVEKEIVVTPPSNVPEQPQVPTPETSEEILEPIGVEQEEKKGKTSDEVIGKDEIVTQKPPKRGLVIKGRISLDNKTIIEAPTDETATVGEEQKAKKKKRKRKKKKEEIKKVEPEELDLLDRKKKKKKKIRHIEIDQEEVEIAVRRTIAEMDENTLSVRAQMRKKKKKERMEEAAKLQEQLAKEKNKLRITEFVSVNELANLMQVNVADVIKKCIELGLMVSINQRLDKDTITLVAAEYGYDVSFLTDFEEKLLEEEEAEEIKENLEPRPPVVTIMGHVDHGKTSLLDYIRQTNVVAGESGGITQHIGAYTVTLDGDRSITFLDTPGHEAFTAMRARGAQLTDIVVLVVAADDAVMPQTVEAISHAQAANVPIIIAINKIDKPNSNPEKIRQQLAERNILVEEWGGKYQCVELSAKTGKNVDLLLEKILLEAELLNLKADPKAKARGAIIEAKLDKGKGIVATVLVKKGTLKIGDPFIAGFSYGRVRAMFDERERRVEIAKPSTPVQVIGFDSIPQAGDLLVVVDSEREAREISIRRQQLKREQDLREIRTITLDNFSQKVKEGSVKELKIIIKGDVDGSVGAISDALMKISNPEVRVNVIHKGVGAISEGDVLLAAASNAIIIGFHVRPNVNARNLAETEKVEIRFYTIIYDVINDVKKAIEGMLTPEKKEEVLGSVEVRDVFKIPKVGTVAGCYVLNGRIVRNNRVRLIRDGLVLFDGNIASLKRFKDDVREVEQGYECGIALEGYNDIKVGDIIEPYRIVELKRKLS